MGLSELRQEWMRNDVIYGRIARCYCRDYRISTWRLEEKKDYKTSKEKIATNTLKQQRRLCIGGNVFCMMVLNNIKGTVYKTSRPSRRTRNASFKNNT